MDGFIGWILSRDILFEVVLFATSMAISGRQAKWIIGLHKSSQTEPAGENALSEPPSRSVGATFRDGGLGAFLLNLGLKQGSKLEEIVAARAVNLCTFLLILVSLPWIVASLFLPEWRIFTILNFTVFVFALAALTIQASGNTGMARRLLLLLVIAHLVTIMTVVGKGHCLEYFFCAVITMPILVFSSRERISRNVAIFIYLCVFAVGIYLQQVVPPPLEFSGLVVPLSHYSNALLLALIVFLVVLYLKNIAVNDLQNMEITIEDRLMALLDKGSITDTEHRARAQTIRDYLELQ